MVKNKQAKILWDSQSQTDKLMMANQPDIMLFDKQQRGEVVTDIATPSDSNIRKEEHEKL